MNKITRGVVVATAISAMALMSAMPVLANEGKGQLKKEKQYKTVFHVSAVGKVELENGEVTNVDLASKSIKVKIWGMEWSVLLDDKTKINPKKGTQITLADVKVGDRVRVHGQIKPELSMTISARQLFDYFVKKQTKNFQGKILSVDATAKTLVLDLKAGRSVTVSVPEGTRIEDQEGPDFGLSTFDDLNIGDIIKVKGVYDERTNTLAASKVQITWEPGDSTTQDDD